MAWKGSGQRCYSYYSSYNTGLNCKNFSCTLLVPSLSDKNNDLTLEISMHIKYPHHWSQLSACTKVVLRWRVPARAVPQSNIVELCSVSYQLSTSMYYWPVRIQNDNNFTCGWTALNQKFNALLSLANYRLCSSLAGWDHTTLDSRA